MTRFAAIFEDNRRKTLQTAIGRMPPSFFRSAVKFAAKRGRERVQVFDLVGVLNKYWQGHSSDDVLHRLFMERPDPSNVQAAVRRHHRHSLDEMISGRPLLFPQKQTKFDIPTMLVAKASREGSEGVSVSVLSQPLMWV